MVAPRATARQQPRQQAKPAGVTLLRKRLVSSQFWAILAAGAGRVIVPLALFFLTNEGYLDRECETRSSLNMPSTHIFLYIDGGFRLGVSSFRLRIFISVGLRSGGAGRSRAGAAGGSRNVSADSPPAGPRPQVASARVGEAHQPRPASAPCHARQRQPHRPTQPSISISALQLSSGLLGPAQPLSTVEPLSAAEVRALWTVAVERGPGCGGPWGGAGVAAARCAHERGPFKGQWGLRPAMQGCGGP